jgi:hypothetical protein
MAEGEIREIADKAMVKDLLNAGYIEEVTPDPKPKEVTPDESAEKPKKKSAGKKKKKASDK